MSKKIWYSKTLIYFWDKYHRDYAKFKLDPESLYIKIKKDINAKYPVKLMPTENTREILGTELWYSDFKKEVTHLFFIDKYLKTFLGNIKLSDLQGIKQFLNINGEEHQVIITKKNKMENIIFYNFSIHVPYEKDGYAFSLGLDQNTKLTLLFCKGERLSVIPEDYYQKLNNSSDKSELLNATAFRIAVNTIAYMNCFPNCISDGVPPNMHDDYNSKELKTISVSEKISETSIQKANVKMVAPHFRKGYFKFLKSDFYTHKKGQIVFVSETMVNGKAKTVYTSDKLSKMEE
jgi:hypothetical protein